MVLSVNIKEAGYKKGTPVINDIQFAIKRGELVGLIGPNGAGKSSTIKSILGIMEQMKGTVEVKEYAYIPERPIMYEHMRLREHIDFLFSTLEEEKQELNRVEELLALFNLTHVVHQYPETFSKGMQQKVMLILAFLKQSPLYIIDEPFMGLDPKAMKKLLEQLEKEKRNGAGILMSTHALDTAEKICDRFVLISGGEIIVQGTLNEIRKKSGIKEGSLLDCFDVLTERNTDAISY
ncbi:ABC transporter ATP-binding protein [Bacillus spongiae]|uniref:ABC transporter ATP-binding protein n=1 Tax=Bacillus spongiae TaxID=2683610 RepID=A0ABU8HAM0_9BACI